VIRKYCYDGDQVIAEYDNGFITALFIYGPGIDEPIALLSTSLYYYHYDGLGSVIALSNMSGVIAERYEYDVFGKCIVHTGAGVDGEWMTGDDTTATKSALRNPYMFTGRRLDDETGLYYYRARYYSPETGRFIQPDPIGYGDGLNMYAYCKNNPINWIDPYGLYRIDPNEFRDFMLDRILNRFENSDDPEIDSSSSSPPNPDIWIQWSPVVTTAHPGGVIAGIGEAALQTGNILIQKEQIKKRARELEVEETFQKRPSLREMWKNRRDGWRGPQPEE